MRDPSIVTLERQGGDTLEIPPDRIYSVMHPMGKCDPETSLVTYRDSAGSLAEVVVVGPPAEINDLVRLAKAVTRRRQRVARAYQDTAVGVAAPRATA